MALLTLINLLLLSLSSLPTLVLADATLDDEGMSHLEFHAKQPGVVVLPSGLQYKILRHGMGNKHPVNKTSCSFHFEGKLATTGKKFDSSHKNGKPTDIRPEQAMKGWSEAMKLMREGDKWELTIPSSLAYGARELPELGVPANSVLVYELELLELFGPTKPAASSCTVIGSTQSNDGDDSPLSFDKCNAKEEAYAVEVHTKWTNEELKSEITRLLKLKENGQDKSMSIKRIDKRLRILNYVVSLKNNVQYDEGQGDDTDKFDWNHDHHHDHEGDGHSHHSQHQDDHHAHDDNHHYGHDNGHDHHHHDHEL